jgi:hypothetical protein
MSSRGGGRGGYVNRGGFGGRSGLGGRVGRSGRSGRRDVCFVDILQFHFLLLGR